MTTESPDSCITLSHHLRSSAVLGAIEGDLGGVIEAIAVAGKVIAKKVRSARLEDVLGDVGAVNVQGEVQQKLDVIANDLMVHFLSRHPEVGVCASEEEDESVVVRPRSAGGRFTALFDPLDGSSNIDVAAGVGTIFSILPNEESDADAKRSALQAGTSQLAAGYILYGSSVLLVLTTGHGVQLFVLDPDLGEFIMVERSLGVPLAKKIRSLNGTYRKEFPTGYQRYLDYTESNGYASRYIGPMVADVHRTLLKGGVFLYPPTEKNPRGKLRLLYEANPMAFLIEQAGGLASDGNQRILEIKPSAVHERTPVVLGSRAEVEHVLSHL